MGATTIAARIKTWVAEVLTVSDLNTEFDNVYNEINQINNAKFTSDTAGRLASTKVAQGAIPLSTFNRAEHTATGGHASFTANNVDTFYLRVNAAAPASKVDIVFDRMTLYDSNGDNPAARLKQEFADSAITVLTADITATGANGLQSGSSEGASEWWFVWTIWGSGVGAAAFLSPDETFGTMVLPANYTHALLVGRVYNDADSDFMKPEASVSGGPDKMVVPFDMAHSYTDPGYHMFGSRNPVTQAPFMIQFGKTTVGSGATVDVTLPLAYRTIHIIAIATRATLYTNQAQIESWYSSALSLTQLRIVNSATASIDFNWLSIGS